MIPLATPMISDLELAAVERVLRSGGLAQGREVEQFEAELSAQLTGGRPVAVVSSGTAALHLLLLALGIGPGDEVIVPSFTFAATANAVHLTGAEAVFVDIEETYCLDPDAVRAAIGPRTAAVMAVHLYGQPAAMGALRELTDRHGLLLLEDAAQAHGASLDGAPVGTLGDGAAFSFYPTKNMTTGEGGAVCLADEAVARRVRVLRNQGMEETYVHEAVGFNLRMTDIAAALGRVQLPRLPSFNDARRANAARYDEAFADLPGVATPIVRPGAVHVYHQYTVRHADRDALAAHLAEAGVASRPYYATPVHAQPVYARALDLPETDRAAAEVLSLPAGPHLSVEDRERVVEAVRAGA